MKKALLSSIILLFAICLISLYNVSCAKKEVIKGDGTDLISRQTAGYDTEKDVNDDEAARKAELERQARLREQAEGLIKDFELENIYFDFDKADLKPSAMAILQKKADWLKENPDNYIRIEGHCDERGTSEYNIALGERRANAAAQYLIALGIEGERISTNSYGEEYPASDGHNEEAWAKNRRDEFKLKK